MLIDENKYRFAIETFLISNAKVHLLKYGDLETFEYTRMCDTNKCLIEKEGLEIEVEISGNMIVKYN